MDSPVGDDDPSSTDEASSPSSRSPHAADRKPPESGPPTRAPPESEQMTAPMDSPSSPVKRGRIFGMLASAARSVSERVLSPRAAAAAVAEAERIAGAGASARPSRVGDPPLPDLELAPVGRTARPNAPAGDTPSAAPAGSLAKPKKLAGATAAGKSAGDSSSRASSRATGAAALPPPAGHQNSAPLRRVGYGSTAHGSALGPRGVVQMDVDTAGATSAALAGSSADDSRARANLLLAASLVLNPDANFMLRLGRPSDAIIVLQPPVWAFRIWWALYPALLFYAGSQALPTRARRPMLREIGWWTAFAFCSLSLWGAFETAAARQLGPPPNYESKVWRACTAWGIAASLTAALFCALRVCAILREHPLLVGLAWQDGGLTLATVVHVTFPALGGWLCALSVGAYISCATTALALLDLPPPSSGGVWAALFITMLGFFLVQLALAGVASPVFALSVAWGLGSIAMQSHHRAIAAFAAGVVAGAVVATSGVMYAVNLSNRQLMLPAGSSLPESVPAAGEAKQSGRGRGTAGLTFKDQVLLEAAGVRQAVADAALQPEAHPRLVGEPVGASETSSRFGSRIRNRQSSAVARVRTPPPAGLQARGASNRPVFGAAGRQLDEETGAEEEFERHAAAALGGLASHLLDA